MNANGRDSRGLTYTINLAMYNNHSVECNCSRSSKKNLPCLILSPESGRERSIQQANERAFIIYSHNQSTISVLAASQCQSTAATTHIHAEMASYHWYVICVLFQNAFQTTRHDSEGKWLHCALIARTENSQNTHIVNYGTDWCKIFRQTKRLF